MPCMYFRWPTPSFIIKAGYGVLVITIRRNSYSQVFGSKAWIKLPQLMLCHRVILHGQFNSSRLWRYIPPITSFSLRINLIKNIFSIQYSTISLQPPLPKLYCLIHFNFHTLNNIILKARILKNICIINKVIIDYVIQIFTYSQYKFTSKAFAPKKFYHCSDYQFP